MKDTIMQKAALLLSILLVLPFFVFNTSVVKAEQSYSIASKPTETLVNQLDLTKRRVNIDENWKFALNDQANAQSKNYDDSSWQNVQLPHDFSADLEYSRRGEAESGYKLGGIGWYRKVLPLNSEVKGKRVVLEFGGVYNNATVYVNGQKLGEHPYGYTPFAFDITEYLDFDSTNIIAVKVDHKFPSSRWYSGSGIYRSVHLTLTDKLYVDHYGVTVTTPKLAEQKDAEVDTNVKVKVNNDTKETQNVKVKNEIRLKGTKDVLATVESEAKSLNANTSATFETTQKVNSPKLWDTKNPNLYEVVTKVLVNDKVKDEVVNEFGYRTIEMKADTGFYLNGKSIKLQGVCMHHDQGALGAEAHYRAIERQVELLKEMGSNAIRVTHNPASDELIEIANRKGILIIDEAFDTWVKAKNGNRYDYSVNFRQNIASDNKILGQEKSNMTWAEFDLKTMVKRGINSPAIIMWSLGNEVMEGNIGPYNEYPGIFEKLINWTREVDTTRFTTIGDNKFKAGNGWNESKQFGNSLQKVNGAVGMNYIENGQKFERYHRDYPNWNIYASETSSAVNSRGVYNPQKYDRLLTSYDESAVSWGLKSSDSWRLIAERDYVAGEFVWTGFDYLGEPTPWNKIDSGANSGRWPSPKSSYFGILDTAGLPKDRFYFYQSQWNDEVNTLHILPAWSSDLVKKNAQNKVRVDVFSDAKKVELFFIEKGSTEEKSLGAKEFTKKTTDNKYSYQVYEGEGHEKRNAGQNMYLTWEVPYKDGTIKAKAYDENNQEITDTKGRKTVTTYGPASKLELTADRQEINADGKDLSYITIDVKDAQGNIVEGANNEVNVKVTGNGELLALDNGVQTDHEPYTSGKRKAQAGKLVAIVKSTKNAGSFTITATATGLTDGTATVTTKKVENGIDPNKVVPVSYTMPKNYYVKLGHKPELVKKVTVKFSDNSTKEYDVVWTENQYNEAKSYSVNGKLKNLDLNVQATVTVVENVETLLNYSISVPKDSGKVALPENRPAVMADGRVLDIVFPVTWEEQNIENYKTVGTYIVNGKANVFGEEKTVTASIRVAEATTEIGANVAPNTMNLKQDIAKELQSDNLDAIKDGNRDFRSVSQGSNTSIWTNYNSAQKGNRKAEITFEFATAQVLGQADLYFYQDAWSARLPESVEVFWSGDGNNWTKLDTKETKGTTNPQNYPNVTKYSYSFNPESITNIKFVINSKDGANPSNNVKYAVGLTEVELLLSSTKFTTNTSADLSKLTVNGKDITENLDKKTEFSASGEQLTVTAESAKNASVTILPLHEGAVRVVTESEDHNLRKTYIVKLNKPIVEDQLISLNKNDEGLPKAIASWTNDEDSASSDKIFKINDGVKDYAGNDLNRWTNWQRDKRSGDWVGILFGENNEVKMMEVSSLKLGFFRDHGTDRPESYTIEYYDGEKPAVPTNVGHVASQSDNPLSNDANWKEVKNLKATEFELNKMNELTFEPVNAFAIRIKMKAKSNMGLAITEFEAYGKDVDEPARLKRIFEEKLKKFAKIYEGLNPADYTKKSWDALNAEVKKFNDLQNTKPDAPYEEKIAQLDKAFKAKEDLVSIVPLRDKISEADKLEKDRLTESSKLDLEGLVKKLNDLLAKKDASREEIAKLVKEADKVIANLKYKPNADTKALKFTISEIEKMDLSEKTAESRNNLQKVLTKAKEAVKDETKTQQEIDKLLEDLIQALIDLKDIEKAEELDRKPLQTAIDSAEALDLTKYTDTSVKNLQNAIKAGKEALAKSDLTQVEMKEAIDKITDAVSKLVVKVVDIEPGDNHEDDNNEGDVEIIKIESGYLKDTVKVRKEKNEKSEIIGKVEIGKFISGKAVGDYLEIEINDTKGYILRKDLQKAPVFVTGYAKFAQNIRDDKEKIVGVLPVNERVHGRRIGNRVMIDYQGVKGKIYNANIVKEPVSAKGYTKFTMNVRNLDGKIVGVVPAGLYVEGNLVKDTRILVVYKDFVGYVYKQNLSKTPIQRKGYAKFTQNVRDINGKIIGVIKANTLVDGAVVEGRVKFNFNGKDGYVYLVNITKEIKVYEGKAKFEQWIRDNQGKKVGILPKGVKVSGKVEGQHLNIQYRGIVGKVWLQNLD